MSAAAAAASALFSVAGRIVLVTGGGRGIGLHIARAFVAGGANVFISSRSAETCERTAAELSAAGPGSCTALAEDLSDEAGVKRLAARLAEAEPRGLDVLVNNAGVAWGGALADYPAAQFSRVFDLNVRTPFMLTQALRPALDRRAGAHGASAPSRIINIGSVTGVVPQPFPTYPYDASKAALHHLTRKLSSELAPRITVNALAPGFVPTRMSRTLLAFVSEDAVRRAIPMARWGDGDDLGGAAIFLASRAGAWVTGQVLVVDGGQAAMPLAMLPQQNEE